MMNTVKNQPTSNPSSIRTRFAIKFLQAMKKLNKKRPAGPSTSMADKHKRYRAIRAAACASMASAVGPRRAWSRALLTKIRRNQSMISHRSLMNKKTKTHRFTKGKRLIMMRSGLVNPNKQEQDLMEDDLRGLVPGGEGMGFCRLLSETAHYVKCLRAQVQVMTNMLHHYSTT